MKLTSLFFFYTQLFYSQTLRIEKKINLSKEVSENSGLIFFNKEIITFNDSGGKSELYVIDPKSGKIKRRVGLENAKNIDWESITQDNEFIYVGDTGNNSGKRITFVIYKILKTDFLKHHTVAVKKIKFLYEDLDKIPKKERGDYFDCEAITFYKEKILLFTKNRHKGNTHIYQIPSAEGTHIAKKIQILPIDCLLTSVDYNSKNNMLLGTAYNSNYKPYIFIIKNFMPHSSKFKKINLTPLLKKVNQIEGVSWAGDNKFYISREYSKKKLNGKKYHRKQKLFLFSIKE